MISRQAGNVLILLTAMSVVVLGIEENTNRDHYSTLERYADESVDPCVDFYDHACGNWEDMYNEEEFGDSFEKVDQEANEQYVGILSNLKKRVNYRRQEPFVRIMTDYYKGCVGVDEYKPMNYWKLFEEFEDLGEYNKNQSKWWLLVGKMRKYGVNGLFITEQVLPQEDDASSSIIDLDKPIEDFAFQPFDKKTLEIVLDNLEVENRGLRKKIWKSVHNFEKKLLKLEAVEDSIGVEVISIKDLNSTWIEEFLGIILEAESFDEETLLSIQNRPYMEALHELLQSQESSFVHLYMKFRFIWFLHIDGPLTFSKLHCVSHMRDQFVQGMSWLLEQKNPDLVRSYDDIKNIFDVLKRNFQLTLEANANQFDEKIMRFFKNKLKNMQINFGNIPRKNTVARLNAFYENITINSKEFYENHLRILHFQTRAEHKFLEIKRPSSKDDFYYLPIHGMASSATPFYLQSQNMVIIQNPLLSLPFYHPQLLDVFKYSLLGFLIGHEITHGFDESGLSYDKNGKLNGPAEEIRSNNIFSDNLECLRKKNARVIDERIADVSGLRLSYETFFANMNQENSRSKELSWSKLPMEKLFFRNFALFFCSKNETDSEISEGTHGTYRSRLFEALSNFDEFGKVYNCPVGSPLRPEKTCQLYR